MLSLTFRCWRSAYRFLGRLKYLVQVCAILAHTDPYSVKLYDLSWCSISLHCHYYLFTRCRLAIRIKFTVICAVTKSLH